MILEKYFYIDHGNLYRPKRTVAGPEKNHINFSFRQRNSVNNYCTNRVPDNPHKGIYQILIRTIHLHPSSKIPGKTGLSNFIRLLLFSECPNRSGRRNGINKYVSHMDWDFDLAFSHESFKTVLFGLTDRADKWGFISCAEVPANPAAPDRVRQGSRACYMNRFPALPSGPWGPAFRHR